MKHKVVVSRRWKDQEIKTTIVENVNGISISVDVTDFLNAMTQEINYIPLTMTKAQLNKKIIDAAKIVIAEMKNQTVKT